MALIKCAECGNSVSTLASACPKCGAPVSRAPAPIDDDTRGAGFKGLAALAIIVVIPMLFIMGNRDSGESAPSEAVATARPAQPAKFAEEEQRQRMSAACAAKRQAKLDEFQKLMAAKQEWEAAGVLRPCAQSLADSELQALVADAEQKSHMRQMVDPTERPGPRQIAIDRLKADYPAFASANATAIGKAEAKIKADQAAEEKKERAAMLAERRKRGVTIGMTQEEVLQSNWGKPQSVNRSTYSFGVHEQWVYGSGNYLYFKDGKLESIQN